MANNINLPLNDLNISSNIISVQLNLSKENFFGIAVAGHFYSNDDGGIYVKSIENGSAVKKDGRIGVGDMIISVNDVNFENLTNDEAMAVLRDAVFKLGPINLVVIKRNLLNTLSIENKLSSSSEKSFEMNKWIKINEWIEKSKRMIGKDINNTEIDNIKLTTKMEMLSITRMARIMSSSNSDLEIKDRQWFKIIVSKSFLGSDIVNWLLNNVQGFNSRKEAKKYADNMLKNNYIKHPFNKNSSFSYNCHYVFNESIL